MPSQLHVRPVIMADGSGTRLWPLSPAGYPKQFLVLGGNTSLLQQAALRLAALRGELFIAHSFSVMESCRRQGRDLIEFTHRSIQAWIEKTAPPSLVPVG